MDFSVSLVLVRLAIVLGQVAAPSSIPIPETGLLARNIWVQADLRDAVADVWATSPTFRAQVRAIAEHPKVHVAITRDAAMLSDAACRAQCEIRSYSSGFIFARVVLPSTADVPELVAHELEHVRERLEGVNLPLAYATHQPGVSQLPDGRFETLRAHDLGRRVKAEAEKGRTLLTRAAPTPR